ncbi:MAG: hypothetical protein R3B90_09845 [Planctomycetaceae bacterium]
MRKYDKVLFHPKHAIPVDFESDNLLFVVPMEDVVAVFRRSRGPLSTEVADDASEDADWDDTQRPLDDDDLD